MIFSVIGLAVVVGAIIVIVKFTIPFAAESFASNSWSTTTGTVVRNVLRSKVSGGERSTSLSIGYLYTVDGVELLGTRVKIDESFEKDTKIASRYPTGKSVLVHFDPDRPWRSVLEPGPVFGLTIFFPLIMLVLGGLFAGLPLLAARTHPPLQSEGSTDASKGRRLTGVLFMGVGVIVVVFGVVMGFLVMAVLGNGGAAKKNIAAWSVVPATVTESGFEEIPGKKASTWQGRIAYEYEVDGEPYASRDYAWKGGGDMHPSAEVVYENRPGDAVMVHVNPQDHTQSYFTATPVETEMTQDIFMLMPTCMLASGLAFACVGLVLILRA